MLIDLNKELKENSLLSHMVIWGMKKSLMEVIHKTYVEKKCEKLDIRFTIEGEEIDIQKIVSKWQEQVERMIKEEAQDIVKNQFNDVMSKFNEIVGDSKEVFDKIINKKLEELEE